MIETQEDETQKEPAPRFTTCEHVGFTQVNNQWSDEMLSQIEHFDEYKVVAYVIRHTKGFQRDEVRLTLEEFVHGRKRTDGTRWDRGIRLKKRSVQYGIEKAVKDGYILRRKDGKDIHFSLNIDANPCIY